MIPCHVHLTHACAYTEVLYDVENTHHLLCCHAYSLNGELACTHVEEVLKIRTKQIDYEDIVKSFLPKVVDLRDTHWNHSLNRGQKG